MLFRVLGPVEIERAPGDVVSIGRRRERALLAVLLLELGRVVQVERLCDLLWDGAPVDGARRALHSHVARLRATVATAGAAAEIRSSGSGYRLDTDACNVDAYQFSLLTGQAAATDLPDDRERLLREALALWRGPALYNAGSDHLRERITHPLTEARVSALESLQEVLLRQGRYAEAIAELTQLAVAYPTRERVAGLRMRALHLAGRTAEALDVYTEVRHRLAGDFGLDPGVELRRLQQAILRGEDLTPPAGGAAAETGRAIAEAGGAAGRAAGATGTRHLDAAVPAAPRPAELPNDLPVFAGRAAVLAELRHLMDDVADRRSPTVLVSVSGAAGVGKTTLAVHWAHRVAERFPDGQLYVDLRGFAPRASAMAASEAVRRLLDSLGVPARQMPSDLDGQVALYRSLLAGRRMLILLDNARDAEQVRPLLPGASGCLVVVTSRNQLVGLAAVDGAYVVTIDVLPVDEARQLLTARLGAPRLDAEPDAVAEIIDGCARLPIALAVVAAHAAVNTRLTLTALADQLRAMRGNLDVFDGGDPAADVRAVFSWSYRVLSAPAARLFRLLGLHAGPEISMPAAASLTGQGRAGTRRALGELLRANLVTERAPGRIVLHDLLRAYARELADTVDSDRRAAVHRILDHYVHSACRADEAIGVHRDDRVVPQPARPGVTPEEPAGHRDGLAWFTVEEATLVAAVHQAAADGFDAHAWQLGWALSHFLDRRGHWHDSAAVQQAALDAATRSGDDRGTAVAHSCLACACIRLGRHDQAQKHLLVALERYEHLGDDLGAAHAHRTLTWTLDGQGRYREALDHARQARGLFARAHHDSGEARALNALGWFRSQLGDHRQAVDDCRRALDLQRRLGARFDQADTLDSLGHAYRHLRQHREAAECYREAVDLYRDFGDRYNEADSSITLGDTYHATGDGDRAREAWRHAAVILDRLEHPAADAVHRRLSQSGAEPVRRTCCPQPSGGHVSDTPGTPVSLNSLIDKLRTLEPQLAEDERRLLWRLIEAGDAALRGATADTPTLRYGMFDPGEDEKQEQAPDPHDVGTPNKVGRPSTPPEG